MSTGEEFPSVPATSAPQLESYINRPGSAIFEGFRNTSNNTSSQQEEVTAPFSRLAITPTAPRLTPAPTFRRQQSPIPVQPVIMSTEFSKYVLLQNIDNIKLPAFNPDKDSLHLWFRDFELHATAAGIEDYSDVLNRFSRFMPPIIQNIFPSIREVTGRDWNESKKVLIEQFATAEEEENRLLIQRLRQCKQQKNDGEIKSTSPVSQTVDDPMDVNNMNYVSTNKSQKWKSNKNKQNAKQNKPNKYNKQNQNNANYKNNSSEKSYAKEFDGQLHFYTKNGKPVCGYCNKLHRNKDC
jgi:hypothetical protein